MVDHTAAHTSSTTGAADIVDIEAIACTPANVLDLLLKRNLKIKNMSDIAFMHA